jgi:hypothetical protein
LLSLRVLAASEAGAVFAPAADAMGLIRSAVKRCGISLPFSGVICPEHIKSICLDAEWRAQINVRQTLVFLEAPEEGDLHDSCAIDPDTPLEGFLRRSPDSSETRRRKRGRDQIIVDWSPRGRVIPYGLYDHQYSWSPAESHSEPAFCSEFQCELKTGTFVLEIVAPAPFEAAVVFERPRWPLLNTERRLMKYALKRLDSQAQQATTIDQGRVEWKVLEPRIGTRYVCVAFQFNGAAMWQDRLKRESLVGRMRQLVGLAPT